jgi:hypothetical protein
MFYFEPLDYFNGRDFQKKWLTILKKLLGILIRGYTMYGQDNIINP